MTPKERFLAVCRFETPDYVPIFGFPGAPGVSGGAMKKTHDNLVRTGMPADVGGCFAMGGGRDVESWYRYWGTTGPVGPGFSLGSGARGFETTSRIEDGFEIIECENGAVTRQVVDNAVTYSMPEFVRYPVRDRESWEFYKERTEPTSRMDADEFEARCAELDDCDMPLKVGAGGSYGRLRGLMGTEGASIALYEDPELVHDIMETVRRRNREYVFPVIERLRPEVVGTGEDLCYNHGMLLSPAHFEEFCAPVYHEIADCAASADVTLFTVDTDGNAMEFVDVAAACGVNGLHPWEVKAGNDLFAVREKRPRSVLFGWLEKETLNEGAGDAIEEELLSKVPPLLEQGGYFPNADHGIQPPATFPNLCKFLTLLHELCGNPEGEFPRMDP